ncbi:MAG: TlpA family protein disulfide reductase [Candidatus Rokubacteria bacterium]|nr:TlpA family protein disulfide reductase [Candidatus Rokubacteria bacterium]
MRVLRLSALLALLLLAAPAAAAPAAPAFSLKTLDGKRIDSRALLGKNVLVVRFQASWCKLCAREAPAIERVHRKYGPRGAQLVAVHVQDTEADARAFLRTHGATYPAGLDPRLRIANRFGFKGTPYTVVIDRKGEMAARIHGPADETRLARVLDPLLRTPPRRKPPARLQ